MNWIRANEQSSDFASARASIVLPVPGRSSSRRWPAGDQAGQRETDDVPLAEDGRLHVVRRPARTCRRTTARRRGGRSRGQTCGSRNCSACSQAMLVLAAARAGTGTGRPGGRSPADEADQRQGLGQEVQRLAVVLGVGDVGLDLLVGEGELHVEQRGAVLELAHLVLGLVDDGARGRVDPDVLVLGVDAVDALDRPRSAPPRRGRGTCRSRDRRWSRCRRRWRRPPRPACRPSRGSPSSPRRRATC